METLEKREQNRCVHSAVCPDCWHQNDPPEDGVNGTMLCRDCGRAFQYQVEVTTEHVTTGLGLCPVCSVLLVPNRCGKVPRHYLENGRALCRGQGQSALRQQECPAPAAE